MERLGARATPSVMFLLRRLKLMAVSWRSRQFGARLKAYQIYCSRRINTLGESMIELRPLQQFLAVAELLHFGRAAQALHMSQPPLTQAVRKLEAQLGVQLFERS